MTKVSNEEQSNNANVLLSAVWVEWMTKYPQKNGLYLITPRGKTETWVGYWNDAMRRFEEAVPDFTDKGIDVDWWAEMPINPNCR